MKSCRCLCCYKPLREGETDYHPTCLKHFFGTPYAPELPYTRKNLDQLAKVVIEKSTTVTGVQKKLSLDLQHDEQGNPARLTIVGIMGRYILKPQSERFTALPEVEDLTMHLAEIARIPVVPHCLIRFADGELNYITRRIDRTTDGRKLAMEDCCQISGMLTEQKYQSSYEHIASIIKQHSSVAGLDVQNFWEQVIFSWIVGNADMHLKNFSLISPEADHYRLTPAYDLVSTALVMPEDTEETALYLQGFKKNLMPFDFIHAMEDSGIATNVAERTLSRFQKFKDKWFECIDYSFITDVQKSEFKSIIAHRLDTLKN